MREFQGDGLFPAETSWLPERAATVVAVDDIFSAEILAVSPSRLSAIAHRL